MKKLNIEYEGTELYPADDTSLNNFKKGKYMVISAF